MPIIIWNDAYSIGISEIDSQHKKLLSIFNELYEVHQKGTGFLIIKETLTKLIDYTKYHFKLEQQMHHEYKFPYSEKHKQEHKEFIDKIDTLSLQAQQNNLLITFETIDFLKDWMIAHILGSDKAFGDYLRKVELQ